MAAPNTLTTLPSASGSPDSLDTPVDGKDFAAHQDPHQLWSAMRRRAPVVQVTLPMVGTVWLTTTHAAASEMLKANDVFVQEPRTAGRRSYPGLQWWMPKTIRVLIDNMLMKDEPEHRRLRGLVDEAFHRRGIEEMRPRLTALADQLLDALPTDRPVDLAAHFARQFPLAVIIELLGLPDHDRACVANWFSALSTAQSPWGLLRAAPKLRRLHMYLTAHFEAERKAAAQGLTATPGLIGDLIAAQTDGRKLSDDELLSMVFLLLVAGHETTTHLITTGIYVLLTHPEERARLEADWSKINLAVEEILRYGSPIQLTKPRFAARDTTLAGVAVRRGDIVMAGLAAANTDPDQFDCPDRFDVFRQPNRHLSFSSGVHFCLGMQLARAEGQIALQRIFERYPDLRLGSAARDIRWTKRLGLRAPEVLAVTLGAKRANV